MTDQSQPVLLVLNTGSSSIKFSLYNAAALTASGPQCLGNGRFRGAQGHRKADLPEH